MALTLVVHSFVADSSLLDCCDLVVFFRVFFFSLHLMLACRPQFGFLRWFQLFYFFHLWFGVSCLLAWLRQPLIFRLPPAFVVWSFFATGICVQSLSFTAFSAVGIRVRPFVFALLPLVSGYQCTCQFFLYHAVRLLLVSFILGDSNWKFFQVGYPVDTLQIPLWSKAHLVFHKVYEIALSECSLHKWAWLMKCRIKVSSFELYKFDSFSPHSRSIPRELMHSYALGCSWVVTVCCNTVGRHG